MLQVVHDVNGGKTRVVEVPQPLALPGHVLVGTTHSVISAGTERYVMQLAQSNLLSKARQRPDHVRRILQKVRDEGLLTTLTQVKAKLNEPLTLGYSAAGTVLACGHGVHDLKPGDRVAVAGTHAAIIAAGRNLCARIPDSVSNEDAAYAPLGAIAMQGVRLAKVELGSQVLVIGLGLLGLITIGLLRASGCRVWGVDVDPSRFPLAAAFGTEVASEPSAARRMAAGAGPDGIDAVLITAAARDNSTIELAADVVRRRGRIVAVGLVGLDVPRDQFFNKEIELTVSHSLGVGRGDARYESSPDDYPVGQARWTVRRNIETVLAAMASGHLPVTQLTTHRFAVSAAPEAYQLITRGTGRYLGVVLDYDERSRQSPPRQRRTSTSPSRDRVGISVVGAGNFVRLMMLPALQKMGGQVSLRGLCTAKGLNAAESGDRYGFAFATSTIDEVMADAETHAVIVATRHDLHAGLVAAGLAAGKHVFVEKPLCINLDELTRVVDATRSSDSTLAVGFNRRFAESVQRLKQQFREVQPLTVNYRFAVPELPPDSWVHDDAVGGGRIIGEACHAIDACVYLTGSPAVRVFAETAGTAGTLVRADDRAFISLRHANGSISSISYQAGGDRAMPAERIEVIGGGKSAVLDNFKVLTVWEAGSVQRSKFSGDKGHAALLKAFVSACATNGAAPIPLEELFFVAEASILAEQSAREGTPFDLAYGIASGDR